MILGIQGIQGIQGLVWYYIVHRRKYKLVPTIFMSIVLYHCSQHGVAETIVKRGQSMMTFIVEPYCTLEL
jgi:hypothetical protein